LSEEEKKLKKKKVVRGLLVNSTISARILNTVPKVSEES